MSFKGRVIKGRLETKWHDFVFTSIIVLMFVIVFCLKLNISNGLITDSSFLVAAWDVSLLFRILCLLIQQCFQVLKKNRMKKFLNLLNFFDEEVLILKYNTIITV